jgi:predicted esterase
MNRFFRRRAEGVYDMEDLAFRPRALGAFIEAAVQHY